MVNYNEDGSIKSFLFSEESIAALKVKADKLNKKGANITLTIGAEQFVELDPVAHIGYMAAEVTLSGMLKYAGWTIIASIDHMLAGNVINAHDGQNVPECYRNSASNCDHCKTQRNRNSTVIIRNDADGTYKQIGRNCLAGYLGMDLKCYAYYLAMWQDVIGTEADCLGDMDDEDFDMSRGPRRASHTVVVPFLNHVSECVRCFGYVSKTASEENQTRSTVGRVYDMTHPLHGKADDHRKELIQKTGYDMDIGDKVVPVVMEALEWIKSVDTTGNDYMYNLQTISAGKVCRDKHFGYLASLLTAYGRAMGKIAEAKARSAKAAESVYVGAVGEKITITASVRATGTFETQYGITHVYTMTDASGNVLVWKTGTRIDEGTMTITGTVKAHSEYRGARQTELTRCKVKAAC